MLIKILLIMSLVIRSRRYLLPILLLIASSTAFAQDQTSFQIGSIKIVGNTRTLTEVIVAETWLYERDKVSEKDIVIAAQQIMNLGYFTAVSYRIEKKAETADIVFEVRERYTWGISPVLNFETNRNIFGLVLLDSNLFGRGKSAGVTLSAGEGTKTLALSYFERHLGWSRFFGSAGFTTSDGVLQGFDAGGSLVAENERDVIAYNAGVGYWLTYDSWVQVALSWMEDNFTLTKSTFLFPDGTTNRTSFGVGYDRVNFYLDHYEGAQASAWFVKGIKSLGGDFDFTKFFMSGRIISKVPSFNMENSTVVLSALIGTSDNAPSHETYSLGGNGSLRGYAPGFLRGEKVVRLSTEYRAPLWYPKIFGYSGVTTLLGFMDTGFAGAAVKPGDFATSIGTGVRLYVKEFAAAGMAFDVGYGIKAKDFAFYLVFGSVF